MLDKKSDAIQALQQILGRTHMGREIREKAIPMVNAWKDNVNTEYGKTDCQICGLILKSNYFIYGCPNCGSKDYKAVN